jgi:hypothetical protein
MMVISNAGCTVTPLWSPDDGWGRGCFPGGWVLVGINICEKSTAEAVLTIATDKCQEVAALCHPDWHFPTFVRLLGCF